MKYLAEYLVLINICGLTVTSIDAYRIMKQHRGLPSSVLFLTALLGGSVGVFVGLQLFRCRRDKALYFIGVPLVILLQVGISAAVFHVVRIRQTSPSAVVAGYLDSLKSPSDETIQQFVRYEMRSDIDENVDVAGDQAVSDAVAHFFSQFDYHIVSEDISEDKSQAWVSVQIINIDTHSLARDLCLNLTARGADLLSADEASLSIHDYFTLLDSALFEGQYPLRSTDAEVSLSYDSGAWQITADADFREALVSRFSSWINDPFLLKPEEVLTVYLNQFSSYSAQEWLWVLQAQDLFSTDSPALAGDLDQLYAEELSRLFSWEITNCKAEGNRAQAALRISTIDMKSILAGYQDKLLSYADSPDSLTDDSSDVSDILAKLLMEAIEEHPEPSVSEISMTLQNNGHTWIPRFDPEVINTFLGDFQGAMEDFSGGRGAEETSGSA